jgi:F-type H+-transporting ATPase subunit alpha
MSLLTNNIKGFDIKDYDGIAESAASISTEINTVGTSAGDIGRIYSVKDGIVRIKGLNNVVSNEKIRFTSGLYGLALNLEMHSVGALILGSERFVNAKDFVFRTGEVLKVPVG